MQQLKWHQQEQQVIGMEITLTFLSVPTLGSSVVGTVALVLTPARSTSTATAVSRTLTTLLVPCSLALWTDEVSLALSGQDGNKLLFEVHN